MSLDLERVKKHIKAEGDDEDDLITGYVESAKAFVEQHCDRTIVEGLPASAAEMTVTKDVEQAILLLVGHWYTNREAVVVGLSAASVPMAVESLLWYRKRF